jgi:hypothetical protein
MFVKVDGDIRGDALGDWPEPMLRDALSGIELGRAHLDSLQVLVLAEFVRRDRSPEPFFGSKRSVRDASRRMKIAVALTDGSLPGWFDALAAGEITFEHAAAIVEAIDDLPDDGPARLLPWAKTTAPDKFRRRVHRVAIPRPRVAEGSITKSADGGVHLRCSFDRYDGEVLTNGLHKIIDQQWRAEHPDREDDKADRPPYSQRLAQALLEMCRRAVNGAPLSLPDDDVDDAVDAGASDGVDERESEGVDAREPGDGVSAGASAKKASGWTRPSPEAFFVIPYPMLLLDAEAAGIPTTLEGDPLPPDVIRKMLVDAKIYPVVLGGDGEILDFGRGKRLFTATQKKAMAVRDGSCQFADCDRPIRYTQAHHTVPWTSGGSTDLCDGAPVCGDDHRKLTDGGYRIERRDGSIYTYDPNGKLIYKRDNRWRM